MKKQGIDYTNQDFFLGIDVHQKNWIVTVRTNNMELKTFSMNPSPEELYVICTSVTLGETITACMRPGSVDIG